ncbi:MULTISPECIES: N-acetylglucosamine kinase [unclassified Streptomyces]|uniref:N-acetylglucosamine kinase n=1 Tax=unclassified Streptomyces TaxID=2593676 RepID=UPI002DDAD5BA|nr:MULTISPECIES: BadF/BadG/BcrA/BcrD ATPase family protein [unclassified Streptomyces]WSF86724.1 ATPase [Streptomyces sp. NBC_01744]WSC45136.1 ATPase [Streptomyces sp. NBC_01762]WSC55877.1 ATPase [Streptomyces sp. NBC_01761]WSD24796.1 ATPase [Streptomyces sp. NBC_01751]WSJ53284.1 ATPase [Streptomyces sp. NBC_01318]
MGVNAAVLAIDAGNSKTDVALIGPDGTVLSTARGGGFQPQAVSVEVAVDVLGATLDEALAKAREAGGPVDSVGHVSACLANADLPVEERELAEALRARGWGGTVEVRNDTFAILRAGVDEPRGVAVVCGAGINCVGMVPDGRTARFPAIGRISGDWGGGSGLAEEAMWFASRAEDGRGEPTELVRTLPAHFGLDSMYALIEAVHLGHIEFERRHELTPVLFATGAAGDPVARALVHRLAEEVVAMASVALTRLGLLDEEAPVVLGGSVLAARHPQLDDAIAELLAVRAPKAVIRLVAEPPVLGAGLLGLDRTGAAPEVHNRLRAQYG